MYGQGYGPPPPPQPYRPILVAQPGGFPGYIPPNSRTTPRYPYQPTKPPVQDAEQRFMQYAGRSVSLDVNHSVWTNMLECVVLEGYYRFLVLFFNCLLTFGSYFCFDMPSVLQAQFQGNLTCSNSSLVNTTCEPGLGMSPDNYNLLYAIYAWTNALVVIGAGFLVDKLGNRFGCFLFSFLCVLGSCVFALGSMFPGSPAMLPLMLTGRLIFGSGNGSLTIVQNRITAFWFRGKELALAFGITLTFSRLGSVLNFFLTQRFSEIHGLQWALWGGALLCCLGFISAIIVSVLDKVGVRALGLDNYMADNSRKLRFSHIRYFSLSFWLLAFTIMFFYNGVFPFVADASKFFYDKYGVEYGFSEETSSYLAGAVYDVSMLMSPFLGAIIDVVGRRGVLALTCALLTIPVFGLLAFTDVYPLVSALWLGVTYSVAAASMWPSIPLVVSQATVGTAMGITTSIQMIGIGISNLVVGEILGKSQHLSVATTLLRWKYVMIFLLLNTLACVATSLLLSITDYRQAGILNESRKQRQRRERHLLAITESLEESAEREPLLGNSGNHDNYHGTSINN